MKNKSILKLLTSCLVAGATLFSPTAIATNTLSLTSYGSTTKSESFTYNGSSQSSVPTGAIFGSVAGLSQLFLCADVPQGIAIPGTYTMNVISPTTLFNVPGSHQTVYSQQMAATLVNLEHAVLTAPSPLNAPTASQLNALTALNLAEWSVLYNWTDKAHVNATTLDGSNFSMPFLWSLFNPTINSLALSYLGAAAAYTNNPNSDGVVFFQDNFGDQVLMGYLPAPEPSTYLLLGSAISFAFFTQRRRFFTLK